MNTLKFKRNPALPLHALPFIGKSNKKPNGLLSFWSVPTTGGYCGGLLTGQSLAKIYIKHLSEHAASRQYGTLQTIAMDMFGNNPLNANVDQAAFRGQVIGFFTEIERWLVPSAVLLKDEVNSLDNDELLTMANEGILMQESA
ncbi:hypothetical protein ACRN98_23740 [Shewanella oncorhynchi]|uniref:hypothetical protein n=1 Tax=Shewanella TaxID=22 RepID=UPI0021D8B71C|nr:MULTISPECIES: hypothetical protein [unclassified Shewanella]MCU7965176.1 hypothetical protein [Shewanella sp. SW32]MCU7973166.1 hypothetical protein [Shewanella sp. SW29]MCU8036923.1 hypothetical protein [Shewanella sp. SM69]